MFNNLIESSSHRRELKRRGSFVLFTTAGYAILFVIVGVVSINAYEARVQEASTELVTLLNPNDFPIQTAPIVKQHGDPPKGNNASQPVFIRKTAMTDVDDPIAPKEVGTKANEALPMPKGGIVEFGNHDSNPSLPGGSGRSGTGALQTGPVRPVIVDLPAPPPTELTPIPRVLKRNVINSQAILLPKPPYPPLARQVGIQGVVSVQVLIDESGKVVSAKAVGGHALLLPEALKAAYQARFSPTMIGDQPVKVSGVITYNFQLQR